MEDDIDKGIRNRDYILDSNGERMKTAIAQIEKVGMSCYGLRGKVDVLMWFVGGNQRDVLQLQRNLNKLGFRGSGSSLKEDGVLEDVHAQLWSNLLNILREHLLNH